MLLILQEYTRIAAISSKVVEEFTERCPQISERIFVDHNIVDKEEILTKAKQYDSLHFYERYVSDDRVKILTIGRLVEQKGFDIAKKFAKN